MEKLKIGLDIDNVITDFDDEVLKEMKIWDKSLRNTGIVNSKVAHMTKGMFDWTKQETDDFFANNMERIAKNLKPRRNCKTVIDKLIEDGCEIYLISHRAYPHYNHPYEITRDWLEKYKIKYTKLILSKTPDKTEECLENDIDIMIDDRVSQCKIMNEKGINVFVMRTRYNVRDSHNLRILTSWQNLYEEVSKCKKRI